MQRLSISEVKHNFSLNSELQSEYSYYFMVYYGIFNLKRFKPCKDVTLLPLDLCYTNVIFELSSDAHIKMHWG